MFLGVKTTFWSRGDLLDDVVLVVVVVEIVVEIVVEVVVVEVHFVDFGEILVVVVVEIVVVLVVEVVELVVVVEVVVDFVFLDIFLVTGVTSEGGRIAIVLHVIGEVEHGESKPRWVQHWVGPQGKEEAGGRPANPV